MRPLRTKRVYLVDPCLMAARTPAPDREDELPPGALLPPDFPREGYTADQLVELEEWYLVASQNALQRFFFLTRTTHNGSEPTARSVTLCCAIIAKIFGFNPSMSWAAVARQLGTDGSHLCRLRQEIRRRLRGHSPTPTAFELGQIAVRLRNKARKLELAAAMQQAARGGVRKS